MAAYLIDPSVDVFMPVMFLVTVQHAAGVPSAASVRSRLLEGFYQVFGMFHVDVVLVVLR